MSMYLLMSPEIVLLASKSICLPMNTLLNVFCPSLILVAYVQEAEVSARQYPRQPAVSSHIYSMHSSFSVLLSSLSSSQVMCICVYVFEWEIYCYYMCALHVFLPTSVFACFFYGFLLLLWRGHWINTLDTQSIECVCVYVCGCMSWCLCV